MRKSKKIGIAVWALGLVFSMVLLFCLGKEFSATFWITFAFVCVAFASSLVFQLIAWSEKHSSDEQFLKFPAITVSLIYIISQIPICILFAVGAEVIPFKIAIIVNATVLIIAWIAILSSLAGSDHIQKVNSRQKDHHTEL